MGKSIDSSHNRDQTKVKVEISCTKAEKELWNKEAEKLRFGYRTNYLRSMINAGRREFDLADNGTEDYPERTVKDLETRVYSNLSIDQPTDWAELVEIITTDLEDEIEEIVENLAEEGKVSILPRGGIVKEK